MTGQSRRKGQERERRMEQAGKAHTGESRQDRADRTAQTGQSRQDSADRTVQTGENKQVRTTRIRKTGQGKFNHTIDTLISRQQRVPPVNYKSFYIIAYTYGYSPRVL